MEQMWGDGGKAVALAGIVGGHVWRLWVRVAVMALACWGRNPVMRTTRCVGASGAAGAKEGAVSWERGELADSGGAREGGGRHGGWGRGQSERLW